MYLTIIHLFILEDKSEWGVGGTFEIDNVDVLWIQGYQKSRQRMAIQSFYVEFNLGSEMMGDCVVGFP